MQGNDIHEEVTSILARMDGRGEQDGHEPEQGIPSIDEPAPLQDIYVYIVREHDEELDQPADDGVIETTLAQQKSPLLALVTVLFALLLPLASIALQLYLAFHPFIATITIHPKSHQVTLSGTVQLGRLLQQITLRESQTVPTTGTGHQDARTATGYITLYNGLFTEQSVAAGTIFRGSDGVRVVIRQNAVIPAATPDPPAFGQVTVAAQATGTGERGNIAAYDINQPCCASGILAKNTTAFHGGQDERNFQTVAKSDISNAATPLKLSLAERLTTTLRKQLHSGEVLISPRCTTHVTPDHQPGEEGKQVTVSVSEACSALAYNQDALQATVIALLTQQTTKKLGSDYRIIANPHIIVTSAAASKQVRLSFTSISTWTYALNSKEQRIIKKVIAGKNNQDALKLLFSLPGIETASITSSGFGDDTRLPKDPRNIALVVIDGIDQYQQSA
jgi:hypothetical protein